MKKPPHTFIQKTTDAVNVVTSCKRILPPKSSKLHPTGSFLVAAPKEMGAFWDSLADWAALF
jgi:hypothetical protein